MGRLKQTSFGNVYDVNGASRLAGCMQLWRCTRQHDEDASGLRQHNVSLCVNVCVLWRQWIARSADVMSHYVLYGSPDLGPWLSGSRPGSG
eukprot:1086334-Heterocapsa_arctica.AAC.1